MCHALALQRPNTQTDGSGSVDVQARATYLADASGSRPGLFSNSTWKEFVMNDKPHTDLDLQVVDLGDAKELTKGIQAPQFAEENPLVQGKRPGA